MPPAVAAAGITAGAGLLGNFLNRPSSQDRAAQSAQTNALNAQTGLADMMRRLTQNQMDLTGPAYAQGLRHFQDILGGSRAAMSAATLPERRAIGDAYRGSETYINRNLTGASRQREQGELARERAGRLSDLIPGMRGQAASTLLSEADPSRLLSALGQTSGAYGSAAGTAFDAAQLARQQRRDRASQGQDWARLFSLFFDNLPQGRSTRGATTQPNMASQNFARLFQGLNFGGR